MAKGIKWTKSQQKKLSTAVGKFNAKITREIKKNPQLAEYLPTRKSVTELRKNIKSSAELNRTLKEIDRIFRKDALKPVETKRGIKTTNYQIKELKLKINRMNKMREKQRKDLPDDPEYKGILGDIKKNALNPKKVDFDKLTPQGWDAFVRKIEEQSSDRYFPKRMEQYKDNYIKALTNELGPIAAKSGIVEIVKSLSPKEISEAYYSSSLLSITLIYADLEKSYLAQRIKREWLEYLKDKNINPPDTVIVTETGFVDKDKNEFYPYSDGTEMKQNFIKVPGGYVDELTGEFYPNSKQLTFTGDAYIDEKTGEYFEILDETEEYAKIKGGYVDIESGEFFPDPEEDDQE